MSTNWTDWKWSKEHQQHWRSRYNEEGQLVYKWEKEGSQGAAASSTADSSRHATRLPRYGAEPEPVDELEKRIQQAAHIGSQTSPGSSPGSHYTLRAQTGDPHQSPTSSQFTTQTQTQLSDDQRQQDGQYYDSTVTQQYHQHQYQQQQQQYYQHTGSAQPQQPYYQHAGSAQPHSAQQTYQHLTQASLQQPATAYYGASAQAGSSAQSGSSAQQQQQDYVAPLRPVQMATHIEASGGGRREMLDHRFKRVSDRSQPSFFCQGRVFMILWSEPAGDGGRRVGGTRNGSHFSATWLNGTVYSEIRRFIVINNKGTYSQCIPIQTYGGRGAVKRSLVIHDHAVVYTEYQGSKPPRLLPGEEGINKQPLRMQPNMEHPESRLDDASRINFGKVYTIEHNVRVLTIGKISDQDIHLLVGYYRIASDINPPTSPDVLK